MLYCNVHLTIIYQFIPSLYMRNNIIPYTLSAPYLSKGNGVVIKPLRNNFVLVKNCCACQFKDMQKC